MKKEWIEFDGKIEKVNDNSYIIRNVSHKRLMELFNKGMLYCVTTNEDRKKHNDIDEYYATMEQCTQQALKGENILSQLELFTDNEMITVTDNKILDTVKLKMRHTANDAMLFMALQNAFQKNYDGTHKCTVTININ